jgi:hypothetical protein
MVNIDSALKTIYKNDRFPVSSTIADKDLIAYFPDLSLFVDADQFADDKVEFELNESICTDGDLVFGKCNASAVKFTLAHITDDIKDKEFTLTQLVNGIYSLSLGTYKVDTATKQDDLIFKDIVAYDRMKKVDIDVAFWYNGLFPTGAETYTLAQFRASFLIYVGLTQDTSKLPLPNDSMTVKKTIDPAELHGREVIEAIEEINGVFGHINRSGQFTHIILKPMSGLYPSNALFPSDALYPTSEDDTTYTGEVDETITEDMREIIRYEEYTVAAIDKLVIRSDDTDYGAIVGTGTNAYFITGNFLVFGKSASELQTIATNTAGYIFKRPYRPYESDRIGLPYVEVGDLLLNENTDTVKGYVFNRTLNGIQALRDAVSASGSKETKQTTSVNRQFKILDYKTLRIKADVDGVSVEVADLAEQTSTQFEQTATVISLKANAADVNSAFEQTANSIALKVDKSGVITSINLSPEAATIKANKINFNGYATFDVNGNLTTIDGSVLKTGTVVADTVRAGWVYAGNISASQISGGTIQGVVFITTDGARTTTISNGAINSNYAEIDFLSVPTQLNIGGSIQMIAYDGRITAAHINCPDVNGGVPVTSANISAQAVGYATSAGSASTVGSIYGHTTNEIFASDTGYGNIDFQGFDNAAGVNYVQANYQRITSSDVRLKYDIQSLDDIPDDIFYTLKPKHFKYKTPFHGDKVFFGLVAQQLENAFVSHGLDPYKYDLIDVMDVKKYTDDGFYVKDETHRIHYNNFIAWLIKITQNHNNRITELENILKALN